jgi:ABC-type multidrug transport system ATPase subunit
MLFTLRNVAVAYDNKPIFFPVSFELNTGEKIAISGPSGKGKSSLFNVLLGFEHRYQGEVLFEGKPLSPAIMQEIRKQVAWLPQEINVLPTQTVREFIYTPFEYQVNKHKKPTVNQIESLFEELDLKAEILDHTIGSVSGGEKQRIGILTVLLLQRPILFLDEPVAALDARMKKKVVDLLLGDNQLTVLSTSHDAVWNDNCDKIVTL